MRVARLHVVEGGVQARVDGQIELVGGVVGQGNAGSGGLSVVHQHVDAAELLDGQIHHILHHRFVVGARVHVGGHAEHLDAELGLQLLLGRLQLLHVAAGDDQVRALLGIGGGDAVSDGTGAAVLQCREAGAGDDGGLTFEKTHGASLVEWRGTALGSMSPARLRAFTLPDFPAPMFPECCAGRLRPRKARTHPSCRRTAP